MLIHLETIDDTKASKSRTRGSIDGTVKEFVLALITVSKNSDAFKDAIMQAAAFFEMQDAYDSITPSEEGELTPQ